MAAPARPWAPQPSYLLFQGDAGRDPRSAHHTFRFRPKRREWRRQRRQPGIAADPRADAGSARARRRRRQLREIVAGKTYRQRTLRRRQDRRRQIRHFQAQPELLGQRPSDQSRLVEFQRGAVRFLPRRQFLFRGIQSRPLRRAQRDRPDPLEDRLQFPRRARWPRDHGSDPQRAAEIRLRLCVQYAASRLCRYSRAASNCAVVRFSMDQPQFLLQPL